MNVPSATYRLQFNKDFRFEDARRLVPYLHALGISHIYASPLLRARTGSTHGYDVTDPTILNPELGTEEEFAALSHELRSRSMSLLLDIVPNHMAADVENPWWRSILTHGRESPYADFFDIDWESGGGKVTLPILGSPLEEVLAANQIEVVPNAGEPTLRYGDHELPIAPETYGDGDPVAEVLSRQHYRLEYWETGLRTLNYRRFFAVPELVSLCQEHREVFDATHAKILDLVGLGYVDGLRVDHVDGLRDPLTYLERLRNTVTERTVRDDLYIVVEKILAHDEALPAAWPVQGTTGYEFMTHLNGLFVHPRGLDALDAYSVEVIGERLEFDDVAYAGKRQVMEQLFSGEMKSLGHQLCALANGRVDEGELQQALEEVTAALSVYRTYTRDTHVAGDDRKLVEVAVATARRRAPSVASEAFNFVRRILTLDRPEDPATWVRFATRWQQFTSPVTAKGVEDTAFYRYNRLLSMNEVGGNPAVDITTPLEFHTRNQRILTEHPHTLVATSTHDTKRSEDVRARLNALTEIAAEWTECLRRWRTRHSTYRTDVDGTEAPDPNEEYAIYQTLLGAWPADGNVEDLRERLPTVVEKMLREEKVHTDWNHPNAQYEAAVHSFVDKLLSDEAFTREMNLLFVRIAIPSVVNSLGQVVLKATSPGVPDFYQGNELWDLSLVDPDNRRPVDFQRRSDALAAIEDAGDFGCLLHEWRDGRVKLAVTARVLRFRRDHHELFAGGDYIPLEPRGRFADNAVAFARRLNGDWAVTIAPRFVSELGDGWPLGEAWGDNSLALPEGAPHVWRNVITGASVSGETFRIADALSDAPVAVLAGTAGEGA